LLKSGPSQLVIFWGFAAILAMLFADFKMPQLRDQTEFYCSLLPAAKLASAHQYPAMYDLGAMTQQTIGSFASHPRTFGYPPLCALVLTPFAAMQPAIGLLAWQGLSLLTMAYCVFLIGRAASRIDAASGESSDSGWYALTFLPTLLGLWSGNGDIIFGILPLTVGYYFAMAKKFLLAGVIFAFCLFKPAFLLPAFVTAFALLAHKRPRCMAGLLIGSGMVLGANAMVSSAGLGAWCNSVKPAFQLTFAVESAKSVQEYIANLPQAILLMLPADKQGSLLSLVLLLAGGVLVLALYQILQMARSLKEEFEITPLAFVTGLFLIPLVVPGVNYSDLTVMLLAGLVIASLEWRQHSDWRLKTTVRVTAIAINAFGLLIIFQPKYAYPLILAAILIVYFRRIVEAVHLAASEHGGVEQVLEYEEFSG
jgi:hypothetical protein